MSIPNLNSEGELPVGIHSATIKEVENIFGKSSDRRKLLMNGLRNAINEFKKINVSIIYIDGSFVTDKEDPNDIDGCWSTLGIEEDNLDRIDSDFWSFSDIGEFQKCRDRILEKYYLDFYIAEHTEGASGKPFPEFFQTNRDGTEKGIILINL